MRNLNMLLAWIFAAAMPVHADELRIGGTGAALGSMQLLANAYAKLQPQTRITVLPSMGSNGSIKAVMAGAIELSVSARPLTEAEIKAGASEYEYGRTPFVFAVSASNPVSALSTQDLVDIYAGTTTQWPNGSKIRVVLRPVGDSDSELIKAISPAMRAAKDSAEKRPGMLFTVTDQETASSIEKIPGAIGPSTLALLLSEKRALKALAFNGVTPDAKTIESGQYPLYKTLTLITNQNPTPDTQGFVAFVLSPAGKKILQQNGHWIK